MTRTTSIATIPRGWRLGRELMRRPQRFSDLLWITGHTDLLNRCLRKLIADDLAVKTNGGLYQLTAPGTIVDRSSNSALGMD